MRESGVTSFTPIVSPTSFHVKLLLSRLKFWLNSIPKNVISYVSRERMNEARSINIQPGEKSELTPPLSYAGFYPRDNGYAQ